VSLLLRYGAGFDILSEDIMIPEEMAHLFEDMHIIQCKLVPVTGLLPTIVTMNSISTLRYPNSHTKLTEMWC